MGVVPNKAESKMLELKAKRFILHLIVNKALYVEETQHLSAGKSTLKPVGFCF